MRENDSPSGIFGNRLLSGWSKIFGKKPGRETPCETNKDKLHVRPFPENHFFSQEELLFLSKNQGQCTLLQGWALQMSLWAKSKSNEQDRNNPCFFPAVQWQDGLMSTWINSEAVPDNIDQQADRLYQLQLDDYEMDADFLRIIEARACRNLVGNYFINGDPEGNIERKSNRNFIRIKGVVDNPGEDLALSLCYYERISHCHASEEIVPYKQFKSLIDKKEVTALTNEAQHRWNEEATMRDDARKLFAETVCLMKRSNTCQGMFPANSSFRVRLSDGKDYVPMAWSLSGDRIRMDFDPRTSIGRSTHFITLDESYLFVDVLGFIHKTMSDNDATMELLSFVRIFGKDFCGDKVLSSGKHPLCHINGIDIDRVTAKASDMVVAFNNDTLETVTLSLEDRKTLLKAVIRHSDILLTELKSSLLRTTDHTAKELLQSKLDNIYRDLSAYNPDARQHTLDELWQHILSLFDMTPQAVNLQVVQIPATEKDFSSQPTKVGCEEPLSQSQVEPDEVQDTTAGSYDGTAITDGVIFSGKTVQKEQDYQATGLIPEGYIRIEPSPRGRWHTPAMMLHEAYRVYGKLLSTKLKRQLDNTNNPWVSKKMLRPRDTNGTIYTGPNAIMLALWMEEQEFELPFFITEDELRANGLGILQDARSFFILNKDEASKVYNIAQTTFPITQQRSYESLKINMIAAERKKTSGYQFLDSESFCKTPLEFDGIPGLSVYSYAEKVIHIASKDRFDTEDDYYRDLAVAMVESTRDVDFDTVRLDAYLFENLVSHLGSGMISQSCRFDATNPEYSRIWRERLENNPEYTRMILEQSAIASCQILESALV